MGQVLNPYAYYINKLFKQKHIFHAFALISLFMHKNIC